jgi:hypothetical protein
MSAFEASGVLVAMTKVLEENNVDSGSGYSLVLAVVVRHFGLEKWPIHYSFSRNAYIIDVVAQAHSV